MGVVEFTRADAGAVTVDWVVLTAATVGMVLAMMTVISRGVEHSVNDIDDHLNAPSVVTRMYNGFGYAPHDTSRFNALLVDMAGLDTGDLEQMAAYSNLLNGTVGDETDPDIAGQIADFNAAVDMAYANAKTTRHTGTTFDQAELTRISAEMGYDTAALAEG
ncbi:MAG: hypothetical protein WBA67_00075 [Jannaschia sp.]